MRKGFTIVELLIVVVVIAILAAITIVAYTGINDRARTTAALAEVNQAHKLVGMYHARNSVYPADLAAAGLADTASVDYDYRSYNNGTIACVAVTTEGKSYQFINDQGPEYGNCIDISVDFYARSSSSTNLEYAEYSGQPTVSGLKTGNVNQSYGANPAVAGGPTDYFVAVYRAFITPPETGTYTIRAHADDRVRLFIDGDMIIDGSASSTNVQSISADVDLTAGVTVPIIYVTGEKTGNYVANLYWTYGGNAEAAIPASAFN